MSEATAALTGDNGATDEAVVTDGATGSGSESSNDSWFSGYDEDTVSYINNKGWDSPDKLLDSYRNLEKMVGGSKNIVEIPPVDADQEVRDKFLNAIGRPNTPDDYSLELPEEGDEGLLNWFKETAHKTGLPADMAKSLYEEFNAMSEQRYEQSQEEMRLRSEEEINSLKKEWGKDFQTKIDQGKMAVNALGYDEESLTNLESKLGTAEMIKLFTTIGSKMGEDNFVSGGMDSFGDSAASARVELNNLRTDEQFMDMYLSGDKAAISKVTRLMEKAHG